MDPLTITLITARMLSGVTSSEFIKAGSRKLTERIFEAKQHHDKLEPDPELPIEILRRHCLQQLCGLQQEIVLYISDAGFLEKVLPLILDFIVNSYEAVTKQDLEILSMSISRIEDAVTAHKSEKKRRNRIRLAAVGISLLSLITIGVFLEICLKYSIGKDTNITIIMLPLPVLIWSIIGSFAAILYRFTNAGDSELDEPLRWLFARPLSGIIMGAIAYLILRVGLITIQAQESAAMLGSLEIMWLIAFLAGFSDRFSDYLLRNIVGKFGGNSTGDLLTLEMTSNITSTESNRFSLLDHIMPKRKRNKELNDARNLTGENDFSKESQLTSPEIEKEVKTANQSKITIVKDANGNN